jgi:hypothetical protein
VSLNPAHGGVRDTRLCDTVCQLLVGRRALWLPPPIKLTATI